MKIGVIDMRKSNGVEKFGILIGKLDLLSRNKDVFIKQVQYLNTKVLRSVSLSYAQKCTFLSDLARKMDEHGYKLNESVK